MSFNVNAVRNIVQQRRAGSTGSSSGASGVVRSLDEPIDWWSREEAILYENWASAFQGLADQYRNPYFDYYYTGQDIKISIEGLGPEDGICLYQFGYSIQQQKQPVYGFWSYTYDGMLRGTRLITGAFSLVVDEPHGLARKIAKAAEIRAVRSNTSNRLNPVRGIDEDEANINRYWRRNIDFNLDVNQQHLFSVHPPFNFLIQYGLQSTSLSTTLPGERSEDIRQQYRGQAPLSSNYNERLVEHITPELNHRILLENVELVSKSVEYNVDGDPILENYAFIARDERIVQARDYTMTAPSTVNPTNGGGIARFRAI